MARLRIDPLTLDRALAVALTISIELEIWLTGSQLHHKVASAIAGPLLTSAIAFRRRYPALVGTGAGIWGVVTATLFPTNLATVLIAWPCGLYALAVWTPTRRFALGLLAYTIPALATTLPSSKRSSGMSFIVISTVLILLVRHVIRDRDQRAQIAERERDVAAREAIVEERARIARELHDVIAHHVSMIVVQAGAERRVLDGAQDSTHEVLETIEHSGRGALNEMRRLLGMLRSDAAELAPQPGLADVATLVTQVREAGLPIDLEIEGEPRELPLGIELSGYRIVQEALTNALKHAGDARATVRIRYGAESLELEILDDGAGTAAGPARSGHGLVGMRERVALYGGRLDAGSDGGGGFTVRALLPIA